MDKIKVALEQSDETISVHANFSNLRLVPADLPWIQDETPDQGQDRKAKANGELILEPIQNVYVGDFLIDLEQLGVQLENGYAQKRVKDGGGSYASTHFRFGGQSDLSEAEQTSRYGALVVLCHDALWRVRIHRNPVPNSEDTSVSINLEARNPLNRPDGTPVTVWRKDSSGKRMGDAPVPILPDFMLRLNEGEIVLISVEK